MVGNGEAVGFVPEPLDQVEGLGVTGQGDGFRGVRNVEPLVFLG